jgi:uncharacterized membrane protein YkoI
MGAVTRHLYRGLLAPALAVFLCGAPARDASAGEPSQTIPLQQVPPAARKTIQDELGHATLGEIQPGEEDGKKTYTVNLTEDGHERELTVAEDGTLLSKEVALEQTPPPVRNTIQGQLRQGSLVSIARTIEDDEINYEVTMTIKDGTERSFTVGLDGKLLSMEMTLADTPAAVRKTIETGIGSGKLESIDHMFEDDGNSYYVEFSREGKARDLSVAEDGKLQSVQVFLSETPPAVQKTINDKLDTGTIIRIDHSFEQQNGVFPYEIEGRKDGKPFNFSVGPRGRFLGMDD